MSCRELTSFCSQNGWIDNNTLHYEIIQEDDHQIIAYVQFEEILTEASNQQASRICCQGRLRLLLDRYGQVTDVELL